MLKSSTKLRCVRNPRVSAKDPHLLDQSRLADYGLAADKIDVASAPAERGLEDALELVEFRFAADECASVGRRRGIARKPP